MKKVLSDLTIHWITSDRFDTKPDKSSWTEVGDSLAKHGAVVNIITSYADEPYQPHGLDVNMVYLKVLDLPLIYRVAFTFFVFAHLLRQAKKRDLIILNQHELWLVPLLKLSQFKNVHLDIRTLPVIGTSLKDRLDTFLFWKLVMRLFGRSASSYSFITQRLLSAVEKEFSNKYQDYCIWQSGVNTDFFMRKIKDAVRGGDKKFTIFYHGSLYERRGIDRVVEAFALLSPELRDQSQFIIVGAGSGLQALHEQVKRLGLESSIELRGLVPYEDIPQTITEADVCICPLPDYPEWNVSSPLKVLEYMASGKPMILTRIPAHTDVLQGQPFVVWAEGDQAEDFAKAIAQAFEQKESLQESAGVALELVKGQWDWKAHGSRFAAYLAAHYCTGHIVSEDVL